MVETTVPGPETLQDEVPEIELAPGLTHERDGRELATQPERPRVALENHQMLLYVPEIDLKNVFVQDHTREVPSMRDGAGHFDGTGYPWLPNSNTFIAGHRLGYTGTPSEHVFWDLPLLEYGDKAILEVANGERHVYQVVDIAEVVPTDLWVVDPLRDKDVLSLQTC